MFHARCSVVRRLEIKLRCSEKKLPRFLKKLLRFRENLLRFWENLPRFRGNLPRFRGNLPRFFSVLSYVLNYTSSEGEREIMNFWGFRFDVLKRRSILWLTSSELVCLQRSSIRWEPKKIPLIAGWMGFFIVQRSADYRIKDAIKRCLRANRKE